MPIQNSYGAELIHFGIKRKSGRYPWGSGERPYQGDGEGYKSKRQLKKEEKALNKKRKAEQAAARKQTREDIRNVKNMSTSELKEKLERVRLEQEYKKLAKESLTSEGEKFVMDILKSVGKTTLTGAGIYAVSQLGSRMSEKQNAKKIEKAREEIKRKLHNTYISNPENFRASMEDTLKRAYSDDPKRLNEELGKLHMNILNKKKEGIEKFEEFDIKMREEEIKNYVNNSSTIFEFLSNAGPKKKK